MGRRKRFKVAHQQKNKRKKRLQRLKKKNLNIGDYFYDGRYIGPSTKR